MGLRDPRFTAINYQMRGPTLSSVPRHKFMFWVRFVTSQQATTEVDPNSRWPTGASFKILSADRPKFTVKHQTLNQYNKKRVVQTGVEYQPVTLRFYDTYDDELLKLVQSYSTFYYGDFNNESSSAWRHDVVSGEMDMGAGYWGYFNQAATNPDDTYYFERIEIYTFGNNEYTRWDLIKPKIIDFSPDGMDYSEGGTPATGSITLAYEGVIWPHIGETMTEDDVGMMGLDQGEFGDFDGASLNFPSTPESVKVAADRLAAASGENASSYFDALMQAVQASRSPNSTNTGVSLPSSLITVGSALGLDFGNAANIMKSISTLNNMSLGGIASNLTTALANPSSGLANIINSASGILGNSISGTLNSALGQLSSMVGNLTGTGISGLMNSTGIGGALGGLTSGLSNLTNSIGSITQKASSMLGSFGGLGNIFKGFFSDDDFTERDRLVLAQPVTEDQYQEYFEIVDACVAASNVFTLIFKYDSMPRKVKDALDDIKAAQTATWLVIGRTPSLQLYDKVKLLGQYMSVLNEYIYGVQKRANASPAVYDSAVAKAQKLGIKDPTLSGMAASSIIEQSRQNGVNVTDYGATAVDPAIYDYLNNRMGSEIQIGMMSPSVLYRSSTNPIQRALQRQTVVQTDYHVYLDAGVDPELLSEFGGENG